MRAGHRVRIGNQTSYRVPPGIPFDYAISHGFDAFEFFPDRRPSGMGWVAKDLDDSSRAEIRRRAASAGVRLSVHARLPANPRQEEEGPAEGLRLAVDLGATVLVVHLSRDEPLGESAEAVAPLARRCAEFGVRLAIENTAADGPDDFNELFGPLASASGWPPGTAGMCLDIGHANLFPGTRNDFVGYLDRLGPQVEICHIHAHENRGDRDLHLPMFRGPSGEDPGPVEAFVARMNGRGYRGSVILEQWPDPPSLLDAARNRLKELFGSS